jgi:hypothetical protein
VVAIDAATDQLDGLHAELVVGGLTNEGTQHHIGALPAKRPDHEVCGHTLNGALIEVRGTGCASLGRAVIVPK